ncbi:MAG: hypothetical protein IKQ60_08535 [Candidatus Methanomethylophilaceae archaeon]|nr:hypothetical protein [Candidatus Methanomethylophilaceae archaeon]
MKEWKIAVALVAILTVSPFIVLCEGPAEGAYEPSPGIISPDVVSIEYDSSASTNLKVTTDKDLGIRVCQYQIKNSRGIIQLHGPATSSSNVFYLDTAVSTAGYLDDDSYGMYFDNRTTPYLFSIVKVTFNGNGTSMKSQIVHLSTDSLSSYSMPAGFVWNTERDGSGTWITDLSNVDILDNSVTLYAFKGNNIGIGVSASTSAVSAGSDACVLVNLDNNSGVAEIDLSIEYDRSALTLERVEPGNVLNLQKSSIKDYPYVAKLTTNENVRTVGNLLRLTFSVSPDAEKGQYPVFVKVDVAEDYIGKVVPYTVSGTSVTVADKTRGDLNGDGAIDSADSTVLMNRLANIPTGLPDSEFDLNGDGDVNALDSLIMMKYISDMPVSFSDSADDSYTMTISNANGNSAVKGMEAGKTLFVTADDSSTVTASTSSGNIPVTKLADGRFSLTVPSSDFTVRAS